MVTNNERLESHKSRIIEKIKENRFKSIVGVLYTVFAVWLIITAISVLSKPMIFPWWVMDINFIASGLLLVVGILSLLIVFNFIKSFGTHRPLAIMNIVLLIAFFVYLSQSLVNYDHPLRLFCNPYHNYAYGAVSLTLFTIIIGLPSILTIFHKPKPGERRNVKYLVVASIALIIVAGMIGVHYLYLNQQKEGLAIEEMDGCKLYYTMPSRFMAIPPVHPPYFVDSRESTTGHGISEDTYEAIKFMCGVDGEKVLAWWDYALEIELAGKQPVINYASENIKMTIGRPSSLYDTYDQEEKVKDVARFFITDSGDEAKSIAEKYGADLVYLPKQRIFPCMFPVMRIAANTETLFDPQMLDRLYESSMCKKFESGINLRYFEKIFENKEVCIYKLKGS